MLKCVSNIKSNQTSYYFDNTRSKILLFVKIFTYTPVLNKYIIIKFVEMENNETLLTIKNLIRYTSNTFQLPIYFLAVLISAVKN